MNDYYASPPDYVFVHPCGNVVKIEELFFYNPKNPEPRAIIIDDTNKCLDCACYFHYEKTGKSMCQGLEIKLESDVKISYNKKTGERKAICIK